MRQVVLDGAELSTRREVHDLLARQLAFPEWYGANLDALADCLGDIREETLLAVENIPALRQTFGPWADSLLELLEESAQENPRLTLQK